MVSYPTASRPVADKLLTIIVPTYNRAKLVERLLLALKQELLGLEDEVTVLVSDNASTDQTSQVVAGISADWPSLVSQRHPENLGADGNFCTCVEGVTTRYFWIIGDDDLLKRGTLAGIVEVLRTVAPALVYLESEWVQEIAGVDQGDPVTQLHAEPMDSLAFTRRVHVWFTFLSGVIVDRTRLVETVGLQAVRRFQDSSLVQLGWIFPLLKVDAPFVFIGERCVLATKDNSGGYPLVTVFGVRFTRIVREVFDTDSRVGKALLNGNFKRFLPGLIWLGRSGEFKKHHAENPWPEMRAELGHLLIFWGLLLPLGRAPYLIAQLVYQCWRVCNRSSRELGRLRARLSRRPGLIAIARRPPAH